MKRFPEEFADLLSPRGLRVLKQRPHVAPRLQYLTGLIDARIAKAAPLLLERAMADVLVPMEDPIPAWTITGMTDNYAELLPKTVRVSTAMLESRRAKSWQRANEIGLVPMLRSQSFHAFAQALSGRALRKGWGTQLLCYRPGDYSGPHNDHHPEEDDAKHGYVDLHITFSSAGVKQQFLIVERDGHFSEQIDIATRGGVTCYRLPFWHYTTPLMAKRGQEHEARRWLLLGTFLDQPPRAGVRGP